MFTLRDLFWYGAMLFSHWILDYFSCLELFFFAEINVFLIEFKDLERNHA